MSAITMIPVNKLVHHPNNPRREVKNVEEMAESIKVKGILQNLSVVPYDPIKHGLLAGADSDSYIVLIGNRRLEGSKLAGLSELPCTVIHGLSEKEEMDIMLLENIQRENLTTYEQAMAYGFFLDNGDSVSDVAQRTGISTTTIRKKVKLLDLDRDKFEAADARGATLADFMELDKISDPELRNEALESLGTNNWKNTLRSCMEKEANREYIQECIQKISGFAKEITAIDPALTKYAHFDAYNRGRVKVPEDAKTRDYFYKADFTGMYPSVNIYRYQTDADIQENAAVKQKEEELLQATNALNGASKRAYELRYDFIRNFSSAKAKKHIQQIVAFTSYATTQKLCGYYGYERIQPNLLSELTGVELESGYPTKQSLAEAAARAPEYLQLCLGYLLADSEKTNYIASKYDSKRCATYIIHKKNPLLDSIYDFLTSIGYEMSDEEKALRDGTHCLFEQCKPESDAAA